MDLQVTRIFKNKINFLKTQIIKFKILFLQNKKKN